MTKGLRVLNFFFEVLLQATSMVILMLLFSSCLHSLKIGLATISNTSVYVLLIRFLGFSINCESSLAFSFVDSASKYSASIDRSIPTNLVLSLTMAFGSLYQSSRIACL